LFRSEAERELRLRDERVVERGRAAPRALEAREGLLAGAGGAALPVRAREEHVGLGELGGHLDGALARRARARRVARLEVGLRLREERLDEAAPDLERALVARERVRGAAGAAQGVAAE